MIALPHDSGLAPAREATQALAAAPPGRTPVVLATINRPKGTTGVHTHTRALSEGLSAAGVPCEVVSTFSGGRRWTPVFAIRPLLLSRIDRTLATLWHRRWHGTALAQALGRRLSGQAGPLHIVAQCPVSARAALDVRDRMGRADDVSVTMVCHFNHSEAIEYRDQGLLRQDRAFRAVLDFEADVLQAVDRVVYVSGWAREQVEEVRGIRPKSSAVVWNGIASRPTHAAPATRASLGLSAADLVLINVGTLEPRKNQLALIDVFARVVGKHRHAKLVLAGDGPHRSAVERRAAELNVLPNVRLLGHRSDVPALLAAADVYVHFATAENCPMVLLEAARAALPIAAVPAGGVRELQAQLGGCIALDASDPDASAAALEPVLQAAGLRREMGRMNRERFNDRFTQDAMVQAYLDVLGVMP